MTDPEIEAWRLTRIEALHRRYLSGQMKQGDYHSALDDVDLKVKELRHANSTADRDTDGDRGRG